MLHIKKLLVEILGTSFGLVSGIFTSLNNNYADEVRTIKLALLGAVTGFVASKILKWADRKFFPKQK